MKHLIIAIIFFVVTCGSALAERQLTENELNGIFETLTTNSTDTWIDHGTIVASHHKYKAPENADPKAIEEAIIKAQEAFSESGERTPLMEMRYNAIPFNVTYELSNEYTMESVETVKYDGDRFYWEIDVQERQDSVKPDRSVRMAEYFNMSANKKRIFVWDGQKYITYFNPSNHAMVTEGATKRPVTVNGPLTAGLVPWGFGLFSYESLISASSSAIENEGMIELNINWRQYEVTFLLDSAKGYAVIASIGQRGDDLIVCNYDSFTEIQGRWIPAVIVVDVYRADDLDYLKSRDMWELTITDKMPADESYVVPYERDTLVEHHSEDIDKSIQYRSSDIAIPSRGGDSEMLLDLRINAEKMVSGYSQNCATVAMKAVFTKYDLPVDDRGLSLLVDETNGTTLYDLYNYANQRSLFCKAVKTDLRTLTELQGCEVILHLPDSAHYVLLGDVDEKYVRLIDLTSRKIHYRITHSAFLRQWSGGIALLIDIDDFDPKNNLSQIDEARLRKIIGRDDCTYGCYSCTELVQEFSTTYCPAMIGSMCHGLYKQFYDRYAPKKGSSGAASAESMIGSLSTPCINRVYNLTECTSTGQWYEHYIKACQ